jgi:hypothetical protein
VKPALPLRVASVITMLLCLGHLRGMPWTPDRTPRGLAIISDMKAYEFNAMGFSRSYYDFYQGFGLTCSVSLAMLAILLWQLAAMAKTGMAGTRAMIATLLAGFVGYTVVDYFYLFTAPLVFTVPAVLCLAWAWLTAKPGMPPRDNAIRSGLA